jgi:hypothetical protein
MPFDFKFICKDQAQTEIILRQTVLQEFLKEVLENLKKLPKAVIFLNKVGKKEAPNYYEIIKKPMDLTKMTRKLHLYRNLNEFQMDIDLIVKNCKIYNSAEYFLNCADELEAEAKALLMRFLKVSPNRDILNDNELHGAEESYPIEMSIAKYFKMVGFEKCEKKCIEILCDVMGYKIKNCIKDTETSKE